jgi:rubrerythrin
MIASEASTSLQLFVRFVAPFVWRNERKVAAKLDGFASTEAGSALDMLKAAELTEDPKLRRLFFRHAMDEARHAQMFRNAARDILPAHERVGSEYNLIHATRQNLFENMSLVQFVAFVYLAEQRGEAQFRALADHFRERPELAGLFTRIGKDEKFHVSYSKKLLRDFRREGRGREVLRALWYIRIARARDAWLRAGRILGDLMSRLCLSIIYLVVLPPFVLLSRWRDPARAGWTRRELPSSVEAARRQF